MTDRKNFFDQPGKSNMRICDKNKKISTSQGDDYTVDFFARL